jgi:hypothetical protein
MQVFSFPHHLPGFLAHYIQPAGNRMASLKRRAEAPPVSDAGELHNNNSTHVEVIPLGAGQEASSQDFKLMNESRRCCPHGKYLGLPRDLDPCIIYHQCV